MHMTPKAARRLGLDVPPDGKTPPNPHPPASLTPLPLKGEPEGVGSGEGGQGRRGVGRASYTSLGLLGWQFGGNEKTVYAFRCRRDGRIDRTARLPPGAGDNLGQHYASVLAAIARGEYTTEEPA